MKTFVLLVLLTTLATPLTTYAGPAEDALKGFFEGRTVILNLEMPATDDGVDVHPDRANPLDYSALADRLKRHGTALFIGDETMITKVKVKKKHVEFQLAGGGFGTFFDGIGPAVTIPDVPKSRRERHLENAVREESDPERKRNLELELAGERDAREAEQRHNAVQAAQAAEIRRIYMRQAALEGGSRFNIRFERGVPDNLSPDMVMAMLGPWVVFPWRVDVGNDPAGSRGTAPPVLSTEFAGLRKGLLMSEVETLMKDRPRAEERSRDGRLDITDWIYETHLGRLELTFAEGVLVRFGPASPWVDASTGRNGDSASTAPGFRRLR